jgi:hypothetical protein
MAMHDNLIQKMEFQIQIDQESHFDLLAKEIPDIVSQNLEKFIDSSIQEFKINNRFFIIDQLVLDLGQLDIFNLKNDLVDKFKFQFLIEIKKELNKNSLAKIPDHELTFFIFIFFIKNGARPWWLNNQIRHFGEFAEKAFLLKPQKFVQYFRFFLGRPIYRKRIFENLSEDLLVRLLIYEKKISGDNSLVVVYSIKNSLKQKYRNWNESRISSAFKEILLQLFQNSHRIDKPWKLDLAIAEAFQNNHPEVSFLDSPKKWGISYDVNLTGSNGHFGHLRGKKDSFQDTKEDYILIQGFQFYLENGYSTLGKIADYHKYQDINTLFRYLILNQLDLLTDLLLSLGKSNIIKKRFLESISQELLDQFFALVAPSKRKLLEWVTGVFQRVQEDYKPINQTFINVKKSINEITFEFFLNKKLTSITDENYIRFLFKQTAKKFGIKYKDLLFLTVKSLSARDKKYRVFKFSQTLSTIYAKDFPTSNPHLSVNQLVVKKSLADGQTGIGDYRNKDFIYNLFLGLFKYKQGGNEIQVGDWLKEKLKPMSMDSTSDILSLWEVFASKFDLRPEQFLIPLLVEKHKNTSIQISSQSFNFWKKKYNIKGIYSKRRPDALQLIQTLQENRKWIPGNTIRGILMGLKLGSRVDKLDFQLVINLIHKGVSPIIPQYFSWLDKLLKDSQVQSKKKSVYNWFLHQLLVLPKKNLTLQFFQKKTLEFLQVEEELFLDSKEDATRRKSLFNKERFNPGKDYQNDFHPSSYPNFPEKYTHALFRLFEILGRSSISDILPESHKFGDKILLQLLISKYETQFINLLQKHQFNGELRDYILIQAPGWLKKEMLNFVYKNSESPWFSTISSLKKYNDEINWIRLEGTSFNDFLENILWFEIFDAITPSFKDLVALMMQSALMQGLVSSKFWDDYDEYISRGNSNISPVKSSFFQKITALEGSDFLVYVNALNKKKDEYSASKRILESVLFDFDFPVGHSFLGHPIEEFKPYIKKLIHEDKKILLELLDRVESPVMMYHFLKLLDVSTLRFLIQENHKKFGFPAFFKKMEAVFSFFKARDTAKINNFYQIWIGVLYFQIPGKINLRSMYATLFRVLIDEDVLKRETVFSESKWKQILGILQVEATEGKLLFEELGNWHQKLAEVIESAEGSIGVLQEEEFNSYLENVTQEEKNEFAGLLDKVKSPVLLRRLAGRLEVGTLRYLIQELHSKLGYPSLFVKIERVLSFLKIKENWKIHDFLAAWITYLNLEIPGKTSIGTVYASFFKVLDEEGVMKIEAIISEENWEQLLDIFQIEGKEGELILEELGCWPQKQGQVVVSAKSPMGVQQEEEFNAYLQKVTPEKKKELVGFLSKVKSPVLLRRLVRRLEEGTLRYLIQELQIKLGYPSLFMKIELLFSFLKIKKSGKIIDFFAAWITILYFEIPGKTNLRSVYSSLFKVLDEEGVLKIETIISEGNWNQLLEILQLEEKEGKLIFEELGSLSGNLKIEQLIKSGIESTLDFLQGRDPFHFIFNSNNLSFKQYSLLMEYLIERGFFDKSHQSYISDWIKFSTQYQSKKYLQGMLQVYFLEDLKFVSSAGSMKTQLMHDFLEKLNSDVTEINLFLDRLSFFPSLIQGIPWMPIEGMGKAVLGNWKGTWSGVNRKVTHAIESNDWSELTFTLFLNYGKSFFSKQKDFQVQVPGIYKQLELIPFKDLFNYRIHPELFPEFFKIKSLKEIHDYFLTDKDPYLKTLKGKSFLVAWFEEFFKSSNEIQQALFLSLFYRSFYKNFYSESQKLNLFLRGFFQLSDAQKSFRIVVGKNLVEMEIFYQTSPEFFGRINNPGAKTNAKALGPLETFQFYLHGGLLPKGISGAQQLANDLSELKGTDLDELRVLIHAGLQNENGRKHFYKLAFYFEETWFLKLIHPNLSKALDKLTAHIRGKVRLDLFQDLRIVKKLDRIIFISSRWANLSVKLKNPLEILLGLVEKWVDLADPQLVRVVFSNDSQKSNLLASLKNSSSKLKKILREEASEEEKSIRQMALVEIEAVDYGEGVGIGNSGLILFWPFYGRFFNALGMVGREGMKGDAIRERAIQLLQYIATGNTEFEEWDLTLNKILCGASPDFPVAPKIDLSEEEEELCNKLMLGSIYNWEKMRGSRMETFRETFVRREGRLYQKENRWELIVDKKAYDVLLDTLPWNISMINLSWMNTRITVQWR